MFGPSRCTPIVTRLNRCLDADDAKQGPSEGIRNAQVTFDSFRSASDAGGRNGDREHENPIVGFLNPEQRMPVEKQVAEGSASSDRTRAMRQLECRPQGRCDFVPDATTLRSR